MPRRRVLELAAMALGATALSGACVPRGCRSHDAPERLAIACADAPGSVARLPEGLAPFSPSLRGEVLRCAKEPSIGPRELARAAGDAKLGKGGFAADVYRFSYRAARATAARTKGAVAGATLIVPHRLRDPEALALWAHGTIGFGEHCAERRPGVFARALAGAGFVTVIPEYAGFGFGAAPGWFSAEDEARSIFDVVRAVGRIMPEGYRPRRLALVGHSQGGHAALAAQALARADGLDVEILGVVAIAPMWFSPHFFAKAADEAAPRGRGDRDALWSALYFYGHAELLDGPGAGAALLADDVRETLEPILKSGCAAEVDAALGARRTALRPAFLADLNACDVGTCSPEATRWRERFRADLPPLDGEGAPVEIVWGSLDRNVTPARARCALDHARAGRPAPRVGLCVDEADHLTIVPSRGVDAIRWLVARDRGDPAELTCGDEPTVPCSE